MWLATGNTDGECHIWDMLTNSVIHTIPLPGQIEDPDMKKGKLAVQLIAWCIERRALLVAYANGLTSEWSIEREAHEHLYQANGLLLLATYSKECKRILVDATKVLLIEGEMTISEYTQTALLMTSTNLRWNSSSDLCWTLKSRMVRSL